MLVLCVVCETDENSRVCIDVDRSFRFLSNDTLTYVHEKHMVPRLVLGVGAHSVSRDSVLRFAPVASCAFSWAPIKGASSKWSCV